MIKKLKLGMPFKGSKRAISSKLVDFILKENPNTKYVYDLFGGGGAMTFEFLQREQIKQVHYNEINTGVVALLKDVLQDGVTDKYYQWVDRATFIVNKANDDWFGGYCKVIWSFGSNLSGYIYGKHIEYSKQRATQYVLQNNSVNKLSLEQELGFDLLDLDYSSNVKTRKLSFYTQLRQNKTRFDFEKLKHLECLQQLEHLGRIKQLEQLQHLQHLQPIISNLSYENVQITTPVDETIIYLDIPYQNTGKYQDEIDYDLLNEYIKNSPYKIYLSSYEYPSLKEVFSIDKRVTISQDNSQFKQEKLFTQ